MDFGSMGTPNWFDVPLDLQCIQQSEGKVQQSVDVVVNSVRPGVH